MMLKMLRFLSEIKTCLFGCVLTALLATGPAHAFPILHWIDDQYVELDDVTGVDSGLYSSNGSDLGTVTLEVDSSDPTIATAEAAVVTQNGTSYQYTLTITARGTGNATLTIDATDSSNRIGTRTLKVWVSPSTLNGSIVVQPTDLPTISEGRDRFVRVKLAKQPRRDVTVSVTSGDASVATVDKDELDFTTTNWSVNQIVTIAGVVDANTDDDTTSVTFAASGGGYTGVDETIAVSVEELPGAPVNSSIRPGNGQVTLSWTAPSVGGTPNGWVYRFRQHPANDPDNWPHWNNMTCDGALCPGDTTQYVVSDDVFNDKTYEFQLAALNESGGLGALSPILTATTDLKPTGFAVASGHERATLSWDALTGVSGWQYRQKADDSSYGAWTDITGSDSTTDSHELSGLTAGSSYTFQIRAKLTDGTFGAESDELAVTPVANAVPNFGLASIADQDYRQHVQITPLVLPAATDGDGTLSYALTPSLPAGLALDVATRTISGAPTASQDATSYSWTAADSDGDAASLQFKIAVENGTAPPSGLVAKSGDGQVTLTWDDHPEMGSSDVYFVRYKKGSTRADLDNTQGRSTTNFSGDATSHTITGLDNSERHVFGLYAFDHDGGGGLSPRSFVAATPDLVPVKPSGVVATPSVAFVRLTWNAIAGVTRWEYRQSHSGSAFTDWTPVPGSDATTTQYDVTGLTNGTTYDFQLRAVRGEVDGVVSDTVTATPDILLPDPPAGLAAVVSEGSVALAWEIPTNTLLTKQQVRWKPSYLLPFTASDSWTDLAISADSRDVTGLTNGISYTFEVRAESISGAGQSAEVTATPTIVAPVKPRGLTAVAGDGTVSLSWQAIANATAWQYQQKQGDGDFGAWTDIAGSGAATAGHELTGLTNGTNYGFRVRAMRLGVSGAVSDSVEATPAAMQTPTGFFATASQDMPDVVNLRWSAAANSAVTKWQYQVAEGSEAFGTDWNDIPDSGATTRTHSVSDLAIGSSWRFRVRAVVGTVPQDASVEKSVTLQAFAGWMNFKTDGCSATLPANPGDITMSRDSSPIEIPIAFFADDCRPMRGHHDGDYSDWPLPWTVWTYWQVGPVDLDYPGQSYNSGGDGKRAYISSLLYRYGQIRLQVSPGTRAGETFVGIRLTDIKYAGEGHPETSFVAGFQVTLAGNPLFGADADIADQHYALDGAITPPTLPAATGGDGKLKYTVTPALPAGLVFDGDGADGLGLDPGVPPTLSGTPTAFQSWTTHTITVHDSDADSSDADSDSIEFRLRVNAPPTVANGVDDQRVEFGATRSVELSSASSPVFGDPNADDVLSIVAVSNVSGQDSPPFTMTRSGDTLTLSAVSEGSGTVTLYATDLGGAVASDSFTVESIVVPDPVTDLIAAPGHGEVSLSWTLPTSGVAPTAVQIRHRAKSETDWSDWSDLPQDAESHLITGLSNGVEYSFEVRTATASGQSAAETVDATPLARPEKPVLSAAPGDGKVMLSWADPGNTSITKYQLQQKEGDAAYGAWADIAGSDANTLGHEVTGLTNETVYGFRIRAVNASGEGAESDEVLAMPQAPRVVTLVLDTASISENAGVATVSATLDLASSAETTVEVSVSPVSPAVSGDYALSATTTLTIAAGSTASSGVVTITGVDNDVDALDKTVTVSATASNDVGVLDPSPVDLTIADDEAAPTVEFVLDASTIGEAGGVATVSAALDRASGAETTLTVSAIAVTPNVAGDFLVAGSTLTIPAGSTASEGTVTITGVDNDVDSPDVTVTVSGVASNNVGISGPLSVDLTIEDDDAAPTVELVLDTSAISEAGGVATVTATLDHASNEATTVTVSAAHVAPAVAGDFTLSGGTLTIAAFSTESTGTVTITGVDNQVDAADRTVTVSATASNDQGVVAPAPTTLTIEDDDRRVVTLVLDHASIGENGGVATVTATLDEASSVETTVTVSATPVAPAVAGDFTLSGSTLTIAAGSTTSTGIVTITGVDNDIDAPDGTVTVSGSASNDVGVSGPSSVNLTIADDDATPMVELVLDESSISEAGGVATVTATLDRASSAVTTLSVSVTPGYRTVSGDFTLSGSTLTIAAGATTSTGTVTITGVDNQVDAYHKTVTVWATASNEQGVTEPDGKQLIIMDDDRRTVTLLMDTTSISENAGVATLTATLDQASSVRSIVAIFVTPVSPAVSDDFIATGQVLRIAAGSTTSTGTVTITGVDNDVDAPDKTVSVLGVVSHEFGVNGPDIETLTITDDDAAPTVELVLDSSTISEAGGVATLSATLDRASSEATTVSVSVTPVSPAVSGDFTLSGSTLTIAAGSTTSTGSVTITGVDNDVDAPGKTVTVSATATNDQGVTAPVSKTLTIEDDDAAPTVELVLDNGSISEAGGVATVSATLDRASSETTTVTVSATPVSPADAGDFTLAGSILTIAAGSTTSAGTVTITGVDNQVDAADRTVTVSATATNDQGVTAPDAKTLTIMDDDRRTVSLSLDASSISEHGGVATVTASLDAASTADTTVTVSATPVSPAVSGDFTLAGSTLTIAAGSTTSTGTVTITGVDNDVDTLDKTVTVSGAASNIVGVSDPLPVHLTIADDDAAPTVELVLDTSSISEAGGVATVSASLDRASGAVTIVQVAAVPNSPAVLGDFVQSGWSLTIAAGSTTSTGLVTITGVDNDVDAPDKQLTVVGLADNDVGVLVPLSLSLTILDEDATPTAELVLDTSSISEDGGVATVTAQLDHPSSEATVVTVSATPVAPAVSGDFTLSRSTLTIAAGSTTSTGTVTVTGVDNQVDAADKTVTVSATASNDHGVTAPAAKTLTIADDDRRTVTLSLDASSISENGGVATVTASLDGVSSVATTVTVSVTPHAPTVTGDFVISGSTLTIAAGSTASTGTVTITGVDNALDELDRTLTVSGSASNGVGVSGPSPVDLTIEDDEAEPNVQLFLDASSISENGGVATVSAQLDQASSGVTTVQVDVVPDSSAVWADFVQSGSTLTIASGSTTSTGTVTITAVDNDVDAPDKLLIILGTANNSVGVGSPSAIGLTLGDDEAAPTAELVLDTSSISEDGGVATVTAQLDHASSEATVVAVSVTPVSPAVSGDFTLSGSTLTIAAGSTTSTGAVTITGIDNQVDAADKTVTVSATASNSHGVTAPAAKTLTIADDDRRTVTLSLDASSISEDGGVATVTASLDGVSSAATTVTVSVSPVSPAVAGDYSVSGSTLTIAAGSTASTGTVKITGVDNNFDDLDRTLTVSGSASNSVGVSGPSQVDLTIADDDRRTLSLHLDKTSISENGGIAMVSARLDNVSSVATTVTVSVSPVSPAVAGDFRLRGGTLTIAAGSKSSTGLVRIEGLNNDVDAPDKTVTVAGSVNNSVGVSGPSPVNLTITDDDAAPTVALVLDVHSISEAGGIAEVSARLDRPSSAVTTVTVSATPVFPAVPGDFVQRGSTLTIAAGSKASTGSVTIEGVDNFVSAPDKTLTVSATASNGQGVTAPGSKTLTIVDNDSPTIFFAGTLAGTDDDQSPAQPSGLVAIEGDAEVTLTWTDPADSSITVYQVKRRAGANSYGSWTDIPGSGADTTSHTVTGLVNGTEHAFRIRAVSAAGNGAESNEAKATPRQPRPETVEGLTATPGDGEVVLSWNDPNDVRVTRYQLRYGAASVALNGSQWDDIPGSAFGTTQHTVHGLQNGLQYTFEVRAASAAGAGDHAAATATPQPTARAVAHGQITKSVLAGVARATLADATDMISRRLQSESDDTTVTLAGQQIVGAYASPIGMPEFTDIDWRGISMADDWLDSESLGFSQEAGSDASLRDSAFSFSLGGASYGSALNWSLWGRGDTSQFKGWEQSGSRDGDNRTVWFGSDVQKNGKWLAGLAFSQSKAEVEYRLDDDEGVINTTLASAWPYVRMKTDNDTDLHLIVGIGDGKVERHLGEEKTDRADLSMLVAAAGARHPFLRVGKVTLSATGDAGLAHMETGVFSSSVDEELRASSWSMRGGIDAVHDGVLFLDSEWMLMPRGGVSLRQDGWNNLKSTGLEMTGGFSLAAPGSRFSIDASGHWLELQTAGETSEWGASLQAQFAPRVDGRGLSWALSHEWGQEPVDVLKGEEDFNFELAESEQAQPSRLTARIDYGIRGQRGLLTPFADVQLSDGQNRSVNYRVGAEYAVRDGLEVEIVGEYRTETSRSPEVSSQLSLRMPF